MIPRRHLLACLALAGLPCLTYAQAPVKIAVTDLAYAQTVSEYFEAGVYQRSSQISASSSSAGAMSVGAYGGAAMGMSQQRMSASEQASGTYVAGTYSYIEQRELGSYTNDIRGAILQGTRFHLVQGKPFDPGAPRPSKAEQVLNQVKTGRMASAVGQPSVTDVIARIRKGEFNGADYVLFGVVSTIDFIDQLSPLQGTSSSTRQYGLSLLADFSLINTRTYEIKAAFSAQGEGNDTKILSSRGDMVAPNRAKVMRETSRSLAASVFEQLAAQLGDTDPRMGSSIRAMERAPVPAPRQPPAEPPAQVIILR
jgi:hypothetical protein